MNDTPHLMLVEAEFYKDISEELVRGAGLEIEQAGATFERICVPGAFEVPAAIRFAVRSMDFFTARRRFDGYVALGCVIRGETNHFDLVCNEVAHGCSQLAVNYTLAIGFGIITCENREQAWARARVEEGNKGGDAARACLEMIRLKRRFRLFPR